MNRDGIMSWCYHSECDRGMWVPVMNVYTELYKDDLIVSVPFVMDNLNAIRTSPSISSHVVAASTHQQDSKLFQIRGMHSPSMRRLIPTVWPPLRAVTSAVAVGTAGFSYPPNGT